MDGEALTNTEEFRLLELYKLLISQKVQENSLIQNRLTWMLIATPIISAIYIVVLSVGSTIVNSPKSEHGLSPFMTLNIEIAAIVCVIISFIGGIISILCLRSINECRDELIRLEIADIDLKVKLIKYSDSYARLSDNTLRNRISSISYLYPRTICIASISISFIGMLLAIGMAIQFPRSDFRIESVRLTRFADAALSPNCTPNERIVSTKKMPAPAAVSGNR